MPKSLEFDADRLAEACKAVLAQKKPNIAKIAREFGVSRTSLTSRVKKAKTPTTPTQSACKALLPFQEKALVNWIVKMYSWNLPPTAGLIQAWANHTLARAGQPDRQVSKMWAYRFEARLPEHLNLAPVKQKTKELKRIQAEDAGFLAHWYDQLKDLLHDVPARLVYNFDECGFQPGQGRSRKVLGSKSSCPDLAETERGETITAVECISADGWLMDPLFIFKGSGKNFMEAWFYGSENLPHETTTALSPNGWISDELALYWLDEFVIQTAHRIKRSEKRYLIFDGHGAHLTLEFLTRCEEYNVIPFGFLPHSTHLCQPLDSKPFLNYKQQFRLMNNELSFWGGRPYGKSEFLQIIEPIRKKAFTQRIIRESFKDRGIWPVDGSKIIENLASQLVIPDLYAPELRSATHTPSPSPPPNISSSSVENSPPNTIKALEKNQAKIIKHLDSLSQKAQRDLTKIFIHQREKLEELAMTQDTIQRIRAAQAPQRRQYTMRQVKPLSQSGILKPRDANRSIRIRKEKDAAAEERKLVKQFEKVYGYKPTQRSEESIQRAIANEIEARERGELFFVDN
jgi:hypothetical protein